jgi:hypothetical protein
VFVCFEQLLVQLERAASKWAALSVICLITYSFSVFSRIAGPRPLQQAWVLIMRLLFSSSDITNIGRVGRQFIEAGIPCGVRYDPPGEGACPAPAHAELWVQNESDFYRAIVLYLRRGGSSQGRIPDLPGQ